MDRRNYGKQDHPVRAPSNDNVRTAGQVLDSDHHGKWQDRIGFVWLELSVAREEDFERLRALTETITLA